MAEENKLLPAIAITEKTGLVIRDLDDLKRAASLFVQSGMFAEKDPAKDLAKACVKIIAGQELGLSTFQAMRGIDIIQGNPTFRYQLIAAKIKQSGRYDYKPIECNAQIARVQFYENGQPVFLSEYSMEDAKAQGLAGKDGYRRMPADMLFARALTKGANKVCPELFYGGCYAPEDFGYVSGEAVPAEAAEITVESKELDLSDPATQALIVPNSNRATHAQQKTAPAKDTVGAHPPEADKPAQQSGADTTAAQSEPSRAPASDDSPDRLATEAEISQAIAAGMTVGWDSKKMAMAAKSTLQKLSIGRLTDLVEYCKQNPR